jgi:hypothetical protein
MCGRAAPGEYRPGNSLALYFSQFLTPVIHLIQIIYPDFQGEKIFLTTPVVFI